MTEHLTDRQILHRQYLQSPIWKTKRNEALAHYGCTCNRCGKYGTDVHHKTYERVGGNELLTDLEVLCRLCHDAHHRVEKATLGTKVKRRSVHRRALFGYLTAAQKRKLMFDFNITTLGNLSYKLVHGEDEKLVLVAGQLLGFDVVCGKPQNKRNRYRGWVDDVNDPRNKESERPWDECGKWVSLSEYKRLN